ncbi:MAG: hypothetical protein JWR26_3614 [Pedosphaera sp.]|nr:hypothetical protein [Pedosphaera sp.]
MNQSGRNELTREELYERVWSAPTTQVAAELGISDVALAKRCKKLNVPKPSLGYWAKVAAGQKPEKVPLPPSAGENFAQTAEKPLPKTLSLPETTEPLHPLAAELLRALTAAKPSYDKRIWSAALTLPEVKVSKGSIEQVAKCFHVIVTNVEFVGIPFRKAQGHNPGFFRKGNDRLHLGIEEELVESVEAARRRNWQSQEDRRVPSGRLTFSLYRDRYSDRDAKRWKNDGKSSLGTLLAEIVAEIRRYFVAAARRREQEAVDREKQLVESERHWREYQAKEAIRLEEERKQKHAEALEAAAHTRSEDLCKAAEWWRLHRVTMEYINECEQRWRSNQAKELTTEQQAWLTWARENAKAMSPFETGYPDPAKDGAIDTAAVPFGGPYPAKRDFPRPPTMPKIPPAVQPTGYPSSHAPEPKQQYPFWLRYQKR